MSVTPQTKAAFDFIAGFIRANGFSPTYDEIAAAMGVQQRATAWVAVNGLIKAGWLRKGKGKRALEVARKPPAPAMPRTRDGLPRLQRTLEQWGAMTPTQVADMPRREISYTLADAKADIATLASALVERERRDA
jgi:SOS-response transcriptional repressor LexA